MPWVKDIQAPWDSLFPRPPLFLFFSSSDCKPKNRKWGMRLTLGNHCHNTSEKNFCKQSMTVKLPAGGLTLMAVVSLLSSRTTVARASGFTPASSSCTHTRSVSSSRPVFRRSEISFTAAHREQENLLATFVVRFNCRKYLPLCMAHAQ